MSQQEVIRRIVERDLRRQDLAERVVIAQDRGLHKSACECFGTWKTALLYAGISKKRVNSDQDYTRDRVTRKIRNLCISGYSLMATRNRYRDRRLYWAAREHFGSWKDALRAAGIDLRRARRTSKPRRYDKQEIIDAVRNWHEAGHSVRWSTVCLENHALARAVKSLYGNWCSVLPEAGIPSTESEVFPHTKWDKQRVIENLQERHRQGKPLTKNKVWMDHPALLSAAIRYFGRWSDALAAAGFAPRTARHMP